MHCSKQHDRKVVHYREHMEVTAILQEFCYTAQLRRFRTPIFPHARCVVEYEPLTCALSDVKHLKCLEHKHDCYCMSSFGLISVPCPRILCRALEPRVNVEEQLTSCENPHRDL